MAGSKFIITLLLAFLANAAASETRVDRAMAAYYPPLMIEIGAEAPGISVEIFIEAAKRAEREYTLELVPFRRAIKTVEKDANALQVALYRNSVREPKYHWIVQTHEVSNVFLTLGSAINSIDEAKALKRIGVEADAAMDVLLTRLGFENLERVDRPEVNAQKLLAGRIDAWALTDELALWTWKRLGYTQPLTVGRAIEQAPVYLVSNLNFPRETADLYAEAVEEMRADGTLERILARYR